MQHTFRVTDGLHRLPSVQTVRNLRERGLQTRGSELKARWDRPYECEGFHRSCGVVEAPTDYLCPLSRVVTAPGRLFGGASPSVAIRNYTFTTKPSFINDVVLTRRYAWFTDSQQAQLYGVPLGRNGRPGGQASVVALPVTGDLGAGRRLQCERHCTDSEPQGTACHQLRHRLAISNQSGDRQSKGGSI